MSMISAPYRFVPLSKLVLLPDWADQVSHDQPFADGLCGELTLRLTTHTPLCVGGLQDRGSEHEPGKVEFFRTPDGQVAIPGSSVKGMLRNVLEIASFGRFKQVEDQRLGVRDLQQDFYKRAIANPQAGWLTLTDGQWQIQPCRYSRLAESDLIEHCKVAKHTWKDRKTAPLRYEVIGICPEVTFDDEGRNTSKPSRAKPNPGGRLKGRIVVTGQPSPAKTEEFIFHDTNDALLTVSSAVMTGFSQIHQAGNEWKFWKKALNDGRLKTGIPVFFHMDGGEVRSLGLAMMYKLAYTHSLRDAIRHTSDEHLIDPDRDHTPDLPDLIFGHLAGNTKNGLRGRVSISLASLAPGEVVSTRWQDPCILNSPKPTYYPTYIRQDGKDKSFRQLMEEHSELAGWKRYPVKPFNLQRPEGKAADNKNTQVRLETVEAGASFRCTLRFHNLRRVELGALLWSIDFGGRSELRHSLGMGKPFGLGQISLHLAGQRMRVNNPTEDVTGNPDQYLQACRSEFIDLMDLIMQSASVRGTWEETDPITALFDYARPNASSQLSYLPNTDDFFVARKQGTKQFQEVFHRYNGVHPLQDYATSLQRKQAEQQRLQTLASASPAQRCLLEVQETLAGLQVTAKPGSEEHVNLSKLLSQSIEIVRLEGSSTEKHELHTLIKGVLNGTFIVSKKNIQDFKRHLDSLLS